MTFLRERAAAAYPLLLLVCLMPSPAHAQGTYEDPEPLSDAEQVTYGSDLDGCIRERYPLDGTVYDPDRDAGLATFESPLPLLENVLFCADAFAGGTMFAQFGQPLFGGLVLILVVWTGITIMYSGRFDLAELLSTILLIGFVAMLLYSYPLPLGGPPLFSAFWGDQSFPLVVSSLGRDLSEALIEDTWTVVATSFRENVLSWRGESVVDEGMDELCSSTEGVRIRDGTVGWSDECAAYLSAKNAEGTYIFVYGFFFIIAAVFGVIPVLVALFSMLWGYFSLAVVTLVGPVLIPWGLIPQTSFLMWGWIRAVVASTVQMIVGAVVFVIVATLLLTPFERYSNSIAALLGSGTEITSGEVWSRGWSMFLEFLPLAVVAMLGAFKTGEITNMILSGGGVPSSGLADRMHGARGAASGVGGAAAGVAAAAGAGAAVASGGASAAMQAGGKVLSAATRTARSATRG